MDRPLVRWDGIKAFSIQQNTPCAGLFKAGEYAQQGGFAGAAFAQQGKELTLLHIKGDGGQHGVLAEAFANILETQERRRCHWLAFTSFQISVYFARRGTSCQKTIWCW